MRPVVTTRARKGSTTCSKFSSRHQDNIRASGQSPRGSQRNMGPKELKTFCELDDATKELLKMAMTDSNLSARAYDRILKGYRQAAGLRGTVSPPEGLG